MARRDTREHCAREGRLPRDLLACRHHRERSGGGDPEGMNRLAHQILAQHRPDGRLPVSTACKWRATRTLEVQVAPVSVHVEHFAEQQRASVPETGREPPELMARVGLGHRRGPVRRDIAGESGDPFGCSERPRIDSQLRGQLVVERQEPGRRHRRRLPCFV